MPLPENIPADYTLRPSELTEVLALFLASKHPAIPPIL